jgi:hypothetical protein
MLAQAALAALGLVRSEAGHRLLFRGIERCVIQSWWHALNARPRAWNPPGSVGERSRA